jgi:hypothetical protein
MTLKLFTPGVPFESSRAGQLTGGEVSRLFLSSRLTSSRACQPAALVNVCMSSSLIAAEYGASDVGKVQQAVGA